MIDLHTIKRGTAARVDGKFPGLATSQSGDLRIQGNSIEYWPQVGGNLRDNWKHIQHKQEGDAGLVKSGPIHSN